MYAGSTLKDYYEHLWEELPEDLDPPEVELRTRLLQSEIRSGDRVLDLGCGSGTFTAVAAAAGAASVIGAEVAEAALLRARIAHLELDFRLVPIDGPLPLDDASVDVVWCSEVIEHIADTAAWLSDVRRVLAPGGRLLLTTPAHGRVRLLLGGVERYSDPQGDHLHLYTARSLRTLLGGFGFAGTRVWAASGPPLFRRTLFARAVRARVGVKRP
ncbi:MAG TPA: class I SAM-dependent methyltransferase [Solirubrobacteraceae bacterium]|nr:class I SAM-dependent methyltransferase [Solirubrobacteraceae bacterium]